MILLFFKMANSLDDGLNKPSQLGSPVTGTLQSVNGQVTDFGTITSSGNTSVVVFTKTFTATPVITCFPTIGSVGVANKSVLSALGTGSFSVATGSNIANTWTAIGSGTY